jgi:hypothetical protein
MVCLVCGARTDPTWRWCPECGGHLEDESEILDLPALEAFPVEWAPGEPAV